MTYPCFPSSKNQEEDQGAAAGGRAGHGRVAGQQERRPRVAAAADAHAGVAAGGDRARGAVLGLRQHPARLQLEDPLHPQHAGGAAGRGRRQVGKGHSR